MSSYTKSKPLSTSCYNTHPPYEIAPGITIYGGSCWHPTVQDADVYGGFDSGMDLHAKYPWRPQTGPTEFLFRITDGSVPKSLPDFKDMLNWLELQLTSGKKVHIGCIGGHGRTGLVLAALRKQMTGDVDATQHVRDNYCKKAVETGEQVRWLAEHFGIKKLQGSKEFHRVQPKSKPLSELPYFSGKNTLSEWNGKAPVFHQDNYGQSKGVSTGRPLYPELSMWGD